MNLFAAVEMPVVLIGASVFMAIGAVVWAAFQYFNAEKPHAEKRLNQLNRPKKSKDSAGLEGEGMRSEALQAVLQRAEALSKPMQSKDVKEINKLKSKLIAAGFRGHSASSAFLGFKFICIVVGLILGGGASLFMYGLTNAALIRVVIVTGIAMFIPDMVLWFISNKRKDQIFMGLPDALDLLVVCVEAGLGLDQALRKVNDEMKKTYRAIADELTVTNAHMQMGRTRSEALQDLGARSGVDDLRQLCAMLIQADRFGTGIANALRVQSDSMRTKRRQMAEEKAAKTAVKLIFPLVIFIFPGIFVVLVGPAAINMVEKMI